MNTIFAFFRRSLGAVLRHSVGVALVLLAGTVSAVTVSSDFNIVGLEPGTFYNGADESGGVVLPRPLARFDNTYNVAWSSWSGFALSRVSDTNTPGWSNQYAVWTPGTARDGSGTYAVHYANTWDDNRIRFLAESRAEGFYVNNTTYAARAMRDGEWPSRAFGPGDWFRLSVTGRDRDDVVTGTVEFYLADFRGDPVDHYILGEWVWVDLTSLGANVRSIQFSLDSSDVGEYGMNTPSYFAMDQFRFTPRFSGGLSDDTAPDGGVPGFVGPAGIGSSDTANHVNPAFAAWASGYVNYEPAPDVAAEWSDPTQALGPVTGNHIEIVSLGDLDAEQIAANRAPGTITLTFAQPIRDKAGPDFVVFENGYGSATSLFAELAYVEVSSDGVNFARFPNVSLTESAVGAYENIDPRKVFNLAGKHANAYDSSWGTPFDLADLASDPLVLDATLDLDAVTHVRIVDIPGSGDFTDSLGNPIYDAWLTWGSGGHDLEAVGVLNSAGAGRIDLVVHGPGRVDPFGYPGSMVSVTHGDSRTFTFTPDDGSVVAAVWLDGVSLGTDSSVTLSDVQSDHTLSVRFWHATHTSQGVPVTWLAGHRLLDSGLDPDVAAAGLGANDTEIWKSFVAGLDPNDPNSRFQILDLARDRTTGRDVLSWLGGTNGSTRPFEVMWAPSPAGPWTLFHGNLPKSNSGTNEWNWVPPSTGPVFYRVRVQENQ